MVDDRIKLNTVIDNATAKIYQDPNFNPSPGSENHANHSIDKQSEFVAPSNYH